VSDAVCSFVKGKRKGRSEKKDRRRTISIGGRGYSSWKKVRRTSPQKGSPPSPVGKLSTRGRVGEKKKKKKKKTTADLAYFHRPGRPLAKEREGKKEARGEKKKDTTSSPRVFAVSTSGRFNSKSPSTNLWGGDRHFPRGRKGTEEGEKGESLSLPPARGGPMIFFFYSRGDRGWTRKGRSSWEGYVLFLFLA